MRESRTYGSARGAWGNPRPYRDPHTASANTSALSLKPDELVQTPRVSVRCQIGASQLGVGLSTLHPHPPVRMGPSTRAAPGRRGPS